MAPDAARADSRAIEQAADARPAVDLAPRLQYTVFRVGTGPGDIRRQCEECIEYGFGAAMVPGRWVPLAADLLSGTPVRVASAVDFPFGSMSEHGRVREAVRLADAGVDELDLAVPIALVIDGEEAAFVRAIRSVVDAVAPVPVKVMLELPLLTSRQRDRAVELSIEAGAAWLKNASSGSVGTAIPAHIRYLRQRAPGHIKIKASGGIARYAQALALVQAGADAVGTSAAVAIATGRTRHSTAADY